LLYLENLLLLSIIHFLHHIATIGHIRTAHSFVIKAYSMWKFKCSMWLLWCWNPDK
jgi:hypothetical protein